MVPRNLTRSYSVVQFLTSKGIAVKPQPPYSPHLAPYDFLFQKAKSARKTPFWINRRHPEVCNAGLKWHSSTCIPGMLQTVAAPLENVCAGTRDSLRRWPYFSWWINKIKLFFFGTCLITLLSNLVRSSSGPQWLQHYLHFYTVQENKIQSQTAN